MLRDYIFPQERKNLDAVAIIGPSALLAFLSGMLSALTPCILPILPPMLAGSMGHKLRPVFIVLGAAVTFTLMGGLFSVFGSLYARMFLRYFFIGMIIVFGAIWADREINELFTRYSSRLVGWVNSRLKGKTTSISSSNHPLLSAFTLGMSLGVVWIPCIGPILGSILAYTTYQGSLFHGSFLLLLYSAGLSLPVLFVAYGGKKIFRQIGMDEQELGEGGAICWMGDDPHRRFNILGLRQTFAGPTASLYIRTGNHYARIPWLIGKFAEKLGDRNPGVMYPDGTDVFLYAMGLWLHFIAVKPTVGCRLH
jgi:cytochrome c biogenesis protein CcdA